MNKNSVNQYFAINSAEKTKIKNLGLGNTWEVLLHLSALAMSGVEKVKSENIINFSDKVNEKSAKCKEKRMEFLYE